MEAADSAEPAMLTGVARSLRAIHDLGEPLPTSFDSFRVVETYADTARERGAHAPAAYDEALATRGRSRRRCPARSTSRCPATTTCWPANFIRGAEQLWIVDWEYAGMGDRYFDLANFAVNNELGEAGELDLLEAYFADVDRRHGESATLRLMKFMSDFREAMWGVVQTALSELDFDFQAYARQALRAHARNRSRPRLRDLARGGA